MNLVKKNKRLKYLITCSDLVNVMEGMTLAVNEKNTYPLSTKIEAQKSFFSSFVSHFFLLILTARAGQWQWHWRCVPWRELYTRSWLNVVLEIGARFHDIIILTLLLPINRILMARSGVCRYTIKTHTKVAFILVYQATSLIISITFVFSLAWHM